MIVDRSISIAVPAEQAFRRCLDIPFVGACLPGADDISASGPDRYRGQFSVRVGPVAVSLNGTVHVMETDAAERTARLRLEGSDRRIGGDVSGDMRIRVVETSESDCQLDVHTEVALSGKLGRFGQAVIVKKTDQIIDSFVQEFSRQLTTGPPVAAPPVAPVSAAPVTAGPAADHPPQAGSEVRTGAVSALFRRGRRIVRIDGARDLPAAAGPPDVGAVWTTRPDAGAVRAQVPVVRAVGAASAAELSAALRPTAGEAGAVAVLPRGAAVGDPGLLAELCRCAGTATQRPVLLVATAPWAALTCARVAATGAAHGIAVLGHPAGPPGTADRLLATVLAQAVTEVRDAGFELPVIAGPAGDGWSARRLRAAGADAVITDPAPAGAGPFGRLADAARTWIRRGL